MHVLTAINLQAIRISRPVSGFQVQIHNFWHVFGDNSRKYHTFKEYENKRFSSSSHSERHLVQLLPSCKQFVQNEFGNLEIRMWLYI